MSQSGAAGVSGSPGQVTVTLTVGDPGAPTVTHPGVANPPSGLPTTGVPLPAEIDVALLTAVTGALIVRLVSLSAGGTRELARHLLGDRRGGAS